jgi:hypothetical protein
MFTNKDYVMMLMSISFMASYNLTILTVLSEILVPYGYTDKDAAVFGFWLNIIGNLGGIIASIIISKTGHFKLVTLSSIILTIIGTIIFQMCVIYIPPSSGYWPVFISLNLTGVVNYTVYSYCMEYAVKLAPKIGESISGGTIIQLFNLFGYIQMRIIEFFMKG